MNTSLDGSFTESFLVSLLRRTAERIFTELTKTAATRSLNHAHLLAMLSVFCFAMVSFHSGTSLSKF